MTVAGMDLEILVMAVVTSTGGGWMEGSGSGCGDSGKKMGGGDK